MQKADLLQLLYDSRHAWTAHMLAQRCGLTNDHANIMLLRLFKQNLVNRSIDPVTGRMLSIINQKGLKRMNWIRRREAFYAAEEAREAEEAARAAQAGETDQLDETADVWPPPPSATAF